MRARLRGNGETQTFEDKRQLTSGISGAAAELLLHFISVASYCLSGTMDVLTFRIRVGGGKQSLVRWPEDEH